jgi:outer membrane receptor protein involved in Fe transport
MELEEVVVTARKRKESLQDVPFSVTAFNEEFIDQSGAISITDVAQFTPNLSFRKSLGRAFDRPAIRGQGPILGAQTVGLFVDGVFIAGTLSSTPLDNVERIEVLKGPQAAAFGRATLAGAINYVTKTPTNDWEGKVTVRGAEHEEYEARGFVSGPLIDNKLAFNFGARHYEYGGEYDNIGPGGGTVGQEQTDGVFGSLYYTPSDTFSLTFRANYFQDDDGHPVNHIGVDSPQLNCFLPNFRGYYCGEIPGSDVVDLELDPAFSFGIERETMRGNLELAWDVNDYTITSLTSYGKEDEDWLVDFAWETNEFFLWQGRTQTINEVIEYSSQEFRVASPADRKVRWLAGIYLYDEESRDPVGLTESEVQNQAAFAQVEVDLGEQWVASLEGRVGEDEITSLNTAGLTFSESFNNFTPRASLTWNQSEDANVYFTISKGTKPGGFNTGVLGASVPASEQARLAGFFEIKEEEAWNYEIGTKRSFADGRINFTLAAFFIDWAEQQLTTAEPYTDVNGDPDTLSLIKNVGQTDVTGLELAVNARLTDELDLTFTYGYTNAELQSACDTEWGAFRGPDPTRCNQVEFPGAADAAGNITPNAPEHTAALTLDYIRPIRNGREFFLRSDLAYESTRYAQVFNLAETGASTVWNLRGGVSGENWRASLWVRNVTDDDTVDSIIRFIDFDTLFFGLRRAFQVAYPRGRQLGATFEYRFGQ